MTPRSMTFLEFSNDPESNKSTDNKNKNKHKLLITEDATKYTESHKPVNRILSRVPPKIEPIKSSELLHRVASFLPQLAASNRAILQKRPEDVDIENLTGAEGEVIEMKLGLGVFEEKKQRDMKESDDSDSSDTEDGKILILPSELKAAAERANCEMDPFERVINSLLLFASDSEGEEGS